MVSVPVAELKARLSHYLRMVRLGGEVQVLDRGVPVARIIGLVPPDNGIRQRLVASGAIRPATHAMEDILGWDLVESDADILGSLVEDREDRL